MRPTAVIKCWNCGSEVSIAGVESMAGEQIMVDTGAYQNSPPEIGDVVAIQDSYGARIKRIVAIGGQWISTREGSLFRDTRRMTTQSPLIMVHHDSFRHDGKSWWQPQDPTVWEQTPNGFRVTLERTNSHPSSLIYGHRSPYFGLRPDRVRDDYPCNMAESRQLREVDSLVLKAEIEVEQEVLLSWWNWKSTGPECQSQQLSPGFHQIVIGWDGSKDHQAAANNAPTIQEHAPRELQPDHPICLTVHRGAMELRHLVVQRPITYWIDETQAKNDLPIQIGPDDYFVIGDNVPLSVDSRHHGTVSRLNIVGKVLTDRSVADSSND